MLKRHVVEKRGIFCFGVREKHNIQGVPKNYVYETEGQITGVHINHYKRDIQGS